MACNGMLEDYYFASWDFFNLQFPIFVSFEHLSICPLFSNQIACPSEISDNVVTFVKASGQEWSLP
jgi:hypothetical protein